MFCKNLPMRQECSFKAKTEKKGLFVIMERIQIS